MTTEPLRIAIIATPRSGNTWLRYLLTRLYSIEGRATHEITEDDWAAMPPQVVHQIHWSRTPEFEARLREEGFHVVALARHPLDALISILHFAWYDHETDHWLQGRGGDEEGLRGASPRSRSFVEYAKGPRAEALLSVSTEWRKAPGAVLLNYEDLVADTVGRLTRLAEELGVPPRAPIEQVVEECALDNLKKGSVNNHYWKGRPGLWRELLPEAETLEIAQAVAPSLEPLGYRADFDPGLTPFDADRAWVRYVGRELVDTMRQNTKGFRTQLDAWRWRVDDAEFAKAAALASAEEALAAKSAARAEADSAKTEADRANKVAEAARRDRDAALEATEIVRREAGIARREAEAAAAEAARIQGELDSLRAAAAQASAEAADRIAHLEADLLGAELELRRFRRLQGLSMRLAEAVQDFRDRHPGVAHGAKAIVHAPTRRLRRLLVGRADVPNETPKP